MLPLSRMLIYGNDINDQVLSGTYTSIATAQTGYFNFGSVSVPSLNRIYIMCGVTTGAALSQSGYYFDPRTPNTRTSIANLPRILFNFGSSYYNGNIYVYGGITRNAPTSSNIDATALYIYNIASNTWSTPTPINKPENGGYCKMVTIGNYIYLHGLNTSLNQMYRFDPSNNSFSTLAASPSIFQSSLAGMCTDGINIYTSTNGNIERYNVSTNTWSTIKSSIGMTGMCTYYRGYVYIQDANKFGRYKISDDSFDIVTTTVPYIRGAMETLDGVFSIMGYDGTPSPIIYKIT